MFNVLIIYLNILYFYALIETIMAKKKKITKDAIVSMYMEYVLEHSSNPSSVYKFAKINNFEETLFYEHFSSFEAIETGVFKSFYSNTMKLLELNEAFQNYNSRNKLLSFYFTFFENLTANRSYVVFSLNKGKNNHLKGLKSLGELKKVFCEFIESLHIETIDLKNDRFEKIQQRSIKESAWFQLLTTIKFWLDDSSPSFEKTDIFIEKSVNASFDILDNTPVKSIIDLGKFLFKEKIHMH